LYVRKDLAAQIWTLGDVTAGGVPANNSDTFGSVQCPTCMPDHIFTFDTTTTPLTHPHGLSIGPDGNLYVADTDASRIAVFDQTGKFIKQIGSPSPDQPTVFPPGQFKTPWDVTIAADGTIIVADTWAHRIQVFDKNGVFKTQWGHYEQAAPGQPSAADGFFGPRAVTLDAAGIVYVADTGNKRIRVYSQTGQLLRTIGTSGVQDGQLNEPVGLAINNATGELFVADSWNKRIQVFDMNTGVFKRLWKVVGWAGSSTDTGTRPYLALDKTGTRLFVTVPDLGKILVYDTQGNPILTFGRLGQPPFKANNEFLRVGGIYADANNELWVTDPDSERILRFNLNSLPNIFPPVANQVNPNGNQGNPNGNPLNPATEPATAAANSPDF